MNDSQGGIEDAEVSFGGGATTPYECEGYRLPTEAEWEFAARSFGAVSGTFTNGANLLPGDEWECDGNLLLDDGSYLDDVLWYCGNTPDEQFHPVGEKEPNGWGLYDMPGNVDEWCHDYWNGADYDGDAIDPWGDPTGNYRVTRGGGWEPWTVRIAHRGSSGPGFPWPGLGFRLARTLGPH